MKLRASRSRRRSTIDTRSTKRLKRLMTLRTRSKRWATSSVRSLRRLLSTNTSMSRSARSLEERYHRTSRGGPSDPAHCISPNHAIARAAT